MRRRELLIWGLAGLANLLLVLLLAVPGLGYVLGPLRRRDEEGGWTELGPAARYAGGEVHPVQLTRRERDGYAVLERRRTVYVVELLGEWVVFGAACTHLGCNVAWDAAARQFDCPCHGGRFARDGSRLAGPPPRPLDRLPVRVADGTLQVRLA